MVRESKTRQKEKKRKQKTESKARARRRQNLKADWPSVEHISLLVRRLAEHVLRKLLDKEGVPEGIEQVQRGLGALVLVLGWKEGGKIQGTEALKSRREFV